MKLSEFNYHLPRELIAQSPIRPRDHSRLLILNQRNGDVAHKHFYDLPDYLQKGDVLVLNNSKVFPARLIGRKKETSGKIEVFLHQKIRSSLWQCLLGGHGRKEGLEVEFGRGLQCVVVKNNNDGTWEVKFNMSGKKMMGAVDKIGQTPLPPYIKAEQESKKARKQESKHYQTVYADDKKIGSVAAPTAGFHFTPWMIKKLEKKGIQIEYITLHVGLGTFSPVKINNIAKHKMHAEWVEVKKGTAQRIIKAKREGQRIIAVGTTSVRTLEGLIAKQLNKPLNQITNYKLPITTFIYPGFKFKIVDAMITNFHLPKSTLLMLVSAFASKDVIDQAYKCAINKKYRFYSYGDAMLII